LSTRKERYVEKGSKKFRYIVTTAYGKELQGELELGDALLPYDFNLKISYTPFKGVLVLDTSVEFKELMRILLEHPPSTIRRIVKVDVCCSIDQNLTKCVESYLLKVRGKYHKVLFGRKGSLKHELLKIVELVALKYRSSEKVLNVLHIEPIDHEVCLGLMGLGEDKFHVLRDKKIREILSNT